MDIELVNDKSQWESFVRNYRPNSLLQSWNWSKFSERQGNQPFRLGLYKDENLVGVALFTKVISKRANYLVCHGGPMINWENPDRFNFFHQYLIELSKKEKVHFFRIRPPMFHSEENLKPFLEIGYNLAPMYFQAEHTLHINLTKSEEELLMNLRKNTRYYVRKAEKQGVQVRISQDLEDLDCLYELYCETVKRQKFVPYPKQYFVDEFEAFAQDDLVDLVFGYHQGQLLSVAMIIYYDQTAYYHHGASIRKNPDVYANYLVQWEAIKRAKQRGMKIYDFWGVSPDDDPNHPRAGLTLFKRGFGGKRIRWLHTLDCPISWCYWPTYVYVKLERWQRGL